MLTVASCATQHQHNAENVDIDRHSGGEIKKDISLKHVELINPKNYEENVYLEDVASKLERCGMYYLNNENKYRQRYRAIVNIGISKDGRLHSIEIQESSGSEDFDNALIKVVSFCSPLPRVPDNVIKDADVIHIRRTWVYTYHN